jgi:hypothetical protein
MPDSAPRPCTLLERIVDWCCIFGSMTNTVTACAPLGSSTIPLKKTEQIPDDIEHR